jgi:hypothetical protein
VAEIAAPTCVGKSRIDGTFPLSGDSSPQVSEPTGLVRPHTNTVFAHQIPVHPHSLYRLTPHALAIRIVTT